MITEKIRLFIVDNDALFLRSLEIEFCRHTDFAIETFTSGELCMQSLSHDPDVVILNYYLDDIAQAAMTGIETLDRIKQSNPETTVVMLSANYKTDAAEDCENHKAFVYAAKNETTFVHLQKIISSVFPNKKNKKEIEQVYNGEAIPFQLSVVRC